VTSPHTLQPEALILVRPRRLIRRFAVGQKCSCDGGGWIVTLDRDRYSSPGDAGMVRYTRCVCLEKALSATR
jgi:hypothetical protein